MITQHDRQYQQAFREYADFSGWNAPYAVTLTLRQSITNGLHRVGLTPELAQQNLRHFLNMLNNQTLGSAFKNYGKAIPVIPVLEGGQFKRLHYHLAIDCPRDNLKEEFPQLVQRLWSRTQWGYDEVDIQADADNGWISYMTKFRDKHSLEYAIDWTNLRRGPSPIDK